MPLNCQFPMIRSRTAFPLAYFPRFSNSRRYTQLRFRICGRSCPDALRSLLKLYGSCVAQSPTPKKLEQAGSMDFDHVYETSYDNPLLKRRSIRNWNPW